MSLLTSVEGDAVRKTIVDGYKATDQVCSSLHHVAIHAQPALPTLLPSSFVKL